LTGFPEGALCDVVDATTGAWAWLEAHPIAGSAPIEDLKPKQFSAIHDSHPDDRDEDSTALSKWKML
jgi:hypothetical protein